MSILEFIKDMFSSFESSFKKLSMPNYFSDQRAKLFTPEKYAKWLREIYAQYGSMIFIQRDKGLRVPQQWMDGLIKIEEEMDKVRREGGAHLFPKGDGTKLSDELKAK